MGFKELLSGWKGPILGLFFGLIGAGVGSLFSDYISGKIVEVKVEELCKRYDTTSEILASTKIDVIVTSIKVNTLVELEKIHSNKEKELEKKVEELMRFKRKIERSWVFKIPPE